MAKMFLKMVKMAIQNISKYNKICIAMDIGDRKCFGA